VFTALIGLVMIPCIALATPVFGLSATNVVVIAAAGVLYMVAMCFYLQALQSESAALVAPLFQAAPVFGFVLAYFVLHEVPSAKELWGGE
jgi:drug/metabolite transporter (DMT)-like permease